MVQHSIFDYRVCIIFIYAFGFSQFERGIRAKTTKPPAMRVVSKNVTFMDQLPHVSTNLRGLAAARTKLSVQDNA